MDVDAGRFASRLPAARGDRRRDLLSRSRILRPPELGAAAQSRSERSKREAGRPPPPGFAVGAVAPAAFGSGFLPFRLDSRERTGQIACNCRIDESIMTRQLTLKDIEAELHGTCTTEAGGRAVELALTDIRPIDGSPRAGGGFVLTFRGPRDLLLPQATYRVAGRTLDAEIFIVPVATEQSGYVYEAVFN